jgi:hypothetical protein
MSHNSLVDGRTGRTMGCSQYSWWLVRGLRGRCCLPLQKWYQHPSPLDFSPRLNPCRQVIALDVIPVCDTQIYILGVLRSALTLKIDTQSR